MNNDGNLVRACRAAGVTVTPEGIATASRKGFREPGRAARRIAEERLAYCTEEQAAWPERKAARAARRELERRAVDLGASGAWANATTEERLAAFIAAAK